MADRRSGDLSMRRDALETLLRGIASDAVLGGTGTGFSTGRDAIDLLAKNRQHEIVVEAKDSCYIVHLPTPVVVEAWSEIYKSLDRLFKQLEKAPVKPSLARHRYLNRAQASRVAAIHAVLGPLDGWTLDERAMFFRRQADIDREISIWKTVSELFERAVSRLGPLSEEQKREVYTLANLAARSPESGIVSRYIRYRLHTITSEQAEHVLSLLSEIEHERRDPANDPSDSARIRLAGALGESRGASALRGLIRRLNDRNRIVQRAAATQLGRLGNPGAVGPLLEIFEKTPDWRVRERIIWALGELGHPTEALKERMYFFDPINLVISWIDDQPLYSNVATDWYTLAENLVREGRSAPDRLAELIHDRLTTNPWKLGIALQVAHLVPLTEKLCEVLKEVDSIPKPVPVPGTMQIDIDSDLSGHAELVMSARRASNAALEIAKKLAESGDIPAAMEQESKNAEVRLGLFSLMRRGWESAVDESHYAEGEAALEKYIAETADGRTAALEAGRPYRFPYLAADPFYYLGVVREKQRRSAEAKESYQAALKVAPNDERIIAALRRMS